MKLVQGHHWESPGSPSGLAKLSSALQLLLCSKHKQPLSLASAAMMLQIASEEILLWNKGVGKISDWLESYIHYPQTVVKRIDSMDMTQSSLRLSGWFQRVVKCRTENKADRSGNQPTHCLASQPDPCRLLWPKHQKSRNQKERTRKHSDLNFMCVCGWGEEGV